MPLSIPTLLDLGRNAVADLRSRLDGIGAFLRKSPELAVTKVLAALAHGCYQDVRFVSEQVTPLFARIDYLERWGETMGLPRKKAVGWQGTVLIAAEAGPPLPDIPEGTVFNRPFDGVEWTLIEDVTPNPGGTVVARARAETPTTGARTNITPTDVLAFVTPIPGVTDITFDDTEREGADLEDPEVYRGRLLDHWRGGKIGFDDSAEKVQGITRAWDLGTLQGPGTVTVAVTTDLFDGDGRYTGTVQPDQSTLDLVQEQLEEDFPKCADFLVVAAILSAQNLTVRVEPNNGTFTDAAEENIAQSYLDTTAPGGFVTRASISAAISDVPGHVNHAIDVPAADVTLAPTAIAVPGAYTWIDLT